MAVVTPTVVLASVVPPAPGSARVQSGSAQTQISVWKIVEGPGGKVPPFELIPPAPPTYCRDPFGNLVPC